MCTDEPNHHSFAPIFKGHTLRTRRIEKVFRFPSPLSTSPDNPLPWTALQQAQRAVKKKRKLSRGQRVTFWGSVVLPPPARTRGRNFNRLPFRRSDSRAAPEDAAVVTIITAFACALGPPYPPRIALQAEPFSTSAYKGLACIFATSPKIDTIGTSTPLHRVRFGGTNTHIYSSAPITYAEGRV